MWLTWFLDDRVAASGMPWPDEIPELRGAGISAVLSLTERNPFPEGLPDAMRHLHLPVPDMTAPAPEVLRSAIGFLRECEAEDRRVLVHCGAGLGRTGTVIACRLVADGMEPGDAIDTVRRARPGSIETPEQERAIYEFRGEDDVDG